MKKKNYKVKLKVKELLEERNITQKKLAERAGWLHVPKMMYRSNRHRLFLYQLPLHI